jgi:hypothetical protein
MGGVGLKRSRYMSTREIEVNDFMSVIRNGDLIHIEGTHFEDGSVFSIDEAPKLIDATQQLLKEPMDEVEEEIARRNREAALDRMAANARELGLDY